MNPRIQALPRPLTTPPRAGFGLCRPLGVVAVAAALSLMVPLQAQSAEPQAKSKASRPAKSRQALTNQAKGLALATETVSEITESQLEVASRVNIGRADCEFRQSVEITPWEGHPGHFHVSFGKRRYLMVPEETTSGAVRLEDKRSGTVWLQIPAKSMLMDAKRGQRLVDACIHGAQRQAASVDASAGSSLGIAPAADGKQ